MNHKNQSLNLEHLLSFVVIKCPYMKEVNLSSPLLEVFPATILYKILKPYRVKTIVENAACWVVLKFRGFLRDERSILLSLFEQENFVCCEVFTLFSYKKDFEDEALYMGIVYVFV